MTTITINGKSKAAKTLLDLAKILAVKNSGITVNESEINENEIVAYSIKGYPILKKEYIRLVNEADERISKGIYTSAEDLDEEIKTWGIN